MCKRHQMANVQAMDSKTNFERLLRALTPRVRTRSIPKVILYPYISFPFLVPSWFCHCIYMPNSFMICHTCLVRPSSVTESRSVEIWLCVLTIVTFFMLCIFFFYYIWSLILFVGPFCISVWINNILRCLEIMYLYVWIVWCLFLAVLSRSSDILLRSQNGFKEVPFLVLIRVIIIIHYIWNWNYTTAFTCMWFVYKYKRIKKVCGSSFLRLGTWL